MNDDPEREPPAGEGERPPVPPPVLECGMCHRSVLESQTLYMGGRRLCFGCAAAWFDEDD